MPRITAATDHTLKANPTTAPAVADRALLNPLWVSVSEAAKLGGVQSKTIRRAISGQLITYRIRGNRSNWPWLFTSLSALPHQAT